MHTDYYSSKKCCISWCFPTSIFLLDYVTLVSCRSHKPRGSPWEHPQTQTMELLNASMKNLTDCIKIKWFGGTSLFQPHMDNTCLTPQACAQHPAASALLQRKANNKRRAAVTPSRFLFDVCEVRSWGTPQHGSPDTAWISRSLTPLPFPTRIPNSFRVFSFQKLYCFCNPLRPGFSRSMKACICKGNSSEQLVPNTQHRIPTHRSFQSPGQDRNWWAQSGLMQPVWGSRYKKNTSAHPLLYLYLGAGNKGNATGFSGSQRQPASHPSHGQTFLLFPSAVHTIMILTK